MPELPPGARTTPLTGLAQRFTQAARYVITGITPSSWFSPFQPLAPMAPDQEGVKGRQFDYSTGANLNYIPRSSEPIGFQDLRALADNCDLLRIAIESRKDQIASLDWIIRPRQPADGGNPSVWYKKGAAAHPDIPKEMQKRIDQATQFLRYPDREHTWDMWVKEWMEDVFVIDAPAIYRRRDRGGRLYSLDLLDGAMFKPLLAADGRRPLPPDPAFQQILHGVPAADFTTEELLYMPWNPRTNHIYGYSKVEQILITINTSIRRSLFQLNWYTEGSQPDAFMGLPKEWSMGEIDTFQKYMDSLLSGNLATRRRLRFVPGEFKYQETKSPPLKDTFDEYLARVICFTFAIAPDPFIEHVSRGAVEKSHTRALEEGLEPNQRYIKAVIDRILWEDFDSDDLEFKYVENREQDPKDQMTIDVGYVKAGIFAVDEVRLERGKNALGGPAGTPMLATATGYVPLAALTQPGVQDALAAAGGPAAQALQHQQGGPANNNQQQQQRQQQPKSNQGANKRLVDHTPDNPHLNMGETEEGEDTDEFARIFKMLDDAAETIELVADGRGGYGPRVNPQASQGGGGNWWPNQPRQAYNDLPYPGASGDSQVSPRQYPRPTGSSWGGGSNDWDYGERREHDAPGRHPAPQTQPRLDYYPELRRALSKALKIDAGTGIGTIDPKDQMEIDLPQASDDTRAEVNHKAWKKVQADDFHLVPKTVPLSKMRATQPFVDKQRVLRHIMIYENEGDQGSDPPILLKLGQFYYILDGHHRVVAAKEIGFTSLICDLLEGTEAGGDHDGSGASESSRARNASGQSGVSSSSPGGPHHVDFRALEQELSMIGGTG